MDTDKIFNCIYCKYTSNRKFNLKTHEINKHSKEILQESKEIVNEIINIDDEDDDDYEEDDDVNEDNNLCNRDIYHCAKCNKEYLTLKYLKNHEEKCNGLNILTCPRCLFVFSTKQSKSRHIKANKCEPPPVIIEKVYIDKKILDEKDKQIETLKNAFIKKQSRENYNKSYIIYMLTTKYHKEDRIYIIGKTLNLTNRLSVYNKTIEHEVVYYRSCKDEDTMNLIELAVLHKLNEYREVANRDRFILPIDKNISHFTSIIDNCCNLLE